MIKGVEKITSNNTVNEEETKTDIDSNILENNEN